MIDWETHGDIENTILKSTTAKVVVGRFDSSPGHHCVYDERLKENGNWPTPFSFLLACFFFLVSPVVLDALLKEWKRYVVGASSGAA
jgi:hypothetical protein